jgi:hypothetical protein
MNDMFVRVVADSVSPEGLRLVTIHAHYPRIIHAELMTHRVFSRNARSSRAVPVETMLREVQTAPFVPWHWGKNQRGMQASEECDAKVDAFINSPLIRSTVSREEAWLNARDEALRSAQAFTEAGYHKQVANRLLEPFSYIDTLISSTEWNNFFFLRDHEAAEPHFHDLAAMIFDEMTWSRSKELNTGEWHLPYISPDEAGLPLDVQQKLSVARCARISYKPFDGDASIERELERYDLLVGSTPLHASPAEHQATPDYVIRGFRGNDQWEDRYENPELHGNFRGWVQYRKTLKDENVPG